MSKVITQQKTKKKKKIWDKSSVYDPLIFFSYCPVSLVTLIASLFRSVQMRTCMRLSAVYLSLMLWTLFNVPSWRTSYTSINVVGGLILLPIRSVYLFVNSGFLKWITIVIKWLILCRVVQGLHRRSLGLCASYKRLIWINGVRGNKDWRLNAGCTAAVMEWLISRRI